MGDSVERWLVSNLGLEQYAGLFADSHISTDELQDLTDDDLRELDVAPDDRRVILAQLEHESSAAPAQATDAEFSGKTPGHRHVLRSGRFYCAWRAF